MLVEILENLDVTLLLVSHDMFFIKELTHRTLVIHQGRREKGQKKTPGIGE
jgi:ABC-type methionine transport system ATPase subunit